MKPPYLIFYFCLMSLGAVGQTVGNTEWHTLEDYKAEEPNIIKNIRWLENNPIATEKNDTKAISEYILKWLSSTPYIEVVLDGIFLESIMSNKKFKYAEKFKVTYLFGKSLYVIQHQNDWSEAQASTRGIEGMVTVYEELKQVDPSITNSTLEKYQRLHKKGKLENYVAGKIGTLAEPLSY